MSGIGLENFTDAEVVALKFAYYRQQRDVFFRLQEKRARGEKINFKERGNDHLFTSATRELTPDELRQFCGSGYFLCEHLAGRTAVDWSFVVVPPDVQIGAAQAQQPVAAEAQQPAPAPPAAQRVNDIADTIDAVGRLTQKVTPAAPALTREDVKGMLREAVEQMKATQPAPAPPAAPDPFELFGKFLDLNKRMAPPAPAPREPADPVDELDKTATFIERIRNISDVVNPRDPGEQGGVVSGIVQLVDVVGKHAGNFVDAAGKGFVWLQRLQAAQHGQQPGGAPSGVETGPAGANAPDLTQGDNPHALPPALASLLPVIVEDCTADTGPERAADAIESVLKAQPELKQMLDELMTAPSISIVQTVAQLTGAHYLARLPHSVAWFNSLKDELAAAGEEGEAEEEEPEGEAVVSRNGDGR